MTVLFKCTGNEHIFKAVRYTYLSGHSGPTINDLKLFPKRNIEPGYIESIVNNVGYMSFQIDTTIYKKIKEYDPTALLVLKDERILFEKYWHNYDENSVTNSFSAAKSIVGLAVLVAVQIDSIKSLDQQVIDFIPELKGEYREEVTVRHLLNMTSGINFDESYGNPFGFMAKAYYGTDLMKKTLSYEAEDKPGEEWKYLGGNTILLSEIVRRVSGMTLSDFVSKHIWKKIGAPHAAYWNLDEEGGDEKAYCCFYTSLRDFARFGFMLADNGLVFDRPVLNGKLVRELKKPVLLNNGISVRHYSMHWWLINYNNVDVIYARGILGQYIIVIPAYEMVIVRLGNERGKKDENEHPEDLYLYLELARSYHDQCKIPLLY